MKKIIFIFLMVGNIIFAQKYYTKTGTTFFKASIATFEPIEAKNNSTSVILNVETGEIAALLFLKSFDFKVALMEEHFNENYIESNKFPKATFRGKIENFNIDEIENKPTWNINGTLTIRDVESTIKAIVEFKKTSKGILLNSKLTVKPEDFNIEIPRIVRTKIAQEIKVFLNYELVKK